MWWKLDCWKKVKPLRPERNMFAIRQVHKACPPFAVCLPSLAAIVTKWEYSCTGGCPISPKVAIYLCILARMVGQGYKYLTRMGRLLWARGTMKRWDGCDALSGPAWSKYVQLSRLPLPLGGSQKKISNVWLGASEHLHLTRAEFKPSCPVFP